MTRTELMNLVQQRKSEMDAQVNEMEEILTAARAGLTPVPTQGAAWDPEMRYIKGDKVEGGYVALKYNKGKNPQTYLGTYWEIPVVTYPAWEGIEDGTVIEEGKIVTYNAKTWKCISQHIKSTVYKPKEGSSKWEEFIEQTT